MASKKGKSAGIVGVGMMDDAEWRAQRDCDTLIEAGKIEADPKRLKAARAEANRRLKAIGEVFEGEASK